MIKALLLLKGTEYLTLRVVSCFANINIPCKTNITQSKKVYLLRNRFPYHSLQLLIPFFVYITRLSMHRKYLK